MRKNGSKNVKKSIMKKAVLLLGVSIFLVGLMGCKQTKKESGNEAPQTTEEAAESTAEANTDSNLESLSGEKSETAEADLPVREYYSKNGEYTDEFGSTWEYSYHIPQITDGTEKASEINQEIAGKYEYYAQCDMSNMENGDSLEWLNINYYTSYYENPGLNQYILSIVVYAEELGEFTEYSVFNYNIRTGERYYDNDDILENIGISKEDAVEATRRAAYKYFVDDCAEFANDAQAGGYYTEALARTTSDQYVIDGAMLYINEKGELVAVVPVASLAGSNWYYRILNLSLDAPVALESIAPTEEDAMNLFLDDQAVQASGKTEGMTALYSGESEMISGEKCTILNMGTDHEENFVREYSFAISGTGAIYEYDIISDSWQPFNDLAGLYSNWCDSILFAVYTNPASMEYQSGIMVVPMHSNINIRVEQIEYDAEFDSFSVLGIVNNFYPCVRGQGYYLEIQPAETIPAYRIVAEYGNITAEWYATYDGKDENGVTYVTGASR